MEVVTTPEAAATGSGTVGGIYLANDWADEGGLLLVTAANAFDAASTPDDELLARLHADVELLHPDLVGQVTERRLIRHAHYTPTFGPGTVRRLAAARAALAGSRIDLAGDHMAAPWVEGAVRSGEMAAARVLAVV